MLAYIALLYATKWHAFAVRGVARDARDILKINYIIYRQALYAILVCICKCNVKSIVITAADIIFLNADI